MGKLIKSIFILLFAVSSAFAQIPPTGIQEEGGSESKPVFTINCVGDPITCSHAGKTGTITVTEADPTVDTADEIEAILTNDNIDFGTGIVTADGIDTLEVYNSGGNLKIEPDVQGDVVLFGDTNVGDAVDGNKLTVKRMAVEGDSQVDIYMDEYPSAILDANTSSWKLRSDTIVFVEADTIRLGKDYGSNNDVVQMTGYLTDVATNKHIQWQVNDTTDNFEPKKSPEINQGLILVCIKV